MEKYKQLVEDLDIEPASEKIVELFLYYIMFHYIILYYITLYYIMSYYIILCYIIEIRYYKYVTP